MERPIVGKRPTYHPNQHHSNFYRVIILISLILVIIWMLLGFQRGQIRSPFAATLTPTRVAQSYFMQAQAYFDAGKLEDSSMTKSTATTLQVVDAITAYKAALAQDPQNARAWAELARIQAYSTQMQRNDTERLARLKEAEANSRKAAELAPDDSTIRAIHAFVLDWYAYNSLVPLSQNQDLLVEAEREASRAFQLDPQNALALAYYAEILTDQQRWGQAEKYALQAVTADPTSMDTHRVYAYILETLGKYNSAIQQYQKAAEISPNMTFLYIRIGQNFREGIKNNERALEYFDRAAKINDQLGVQNPLPYLEIAKTYIQEGQFFVASVNAQKALNFDPTDSHTYGQLGIIYIRARNYEGAVPLLRCAVKNCTAEQNELGKVAVQGLPLSSLSVAYYYVEYGTVLAFLSRVNENYCPEAMPVLEQVRKAYPDDTILVGIVDDSEGICKRVQKDIGAATAGLPTETPLATGVALKASATPNVTPTATPENGAAIVPQAFDATATPTPGNTPVPSETPIP
jgi:tetratricopeptide (TPR) repeat protein